ncbi:DUF1127 domain-containing protein [Tabrizicola sp.]|uniref:DUF1127 domain-containing protein n=1 Tax=Tabrizicola sp. TaxID=2005166 RepID=UPI0035B10A77
MTTLALRLLARRPRPLAALAAALKADRSRKALARLDPHLLRDIGLTREEALAETARPLWDPPAHWTL